MVVFPRISPHIQREREREIYIYIYVYVNLSSTAFSSCEDAYSNVVFVLSANFGSRESGEDRRFSSLDVVAVALVGLTPVFAPITPRNLNRFRP